MAERADKGILIYGVRQTISVRSEKSVASYEALIGAMSAGGKATASMTEALAALTPVDDDT